MTRHGKPVHNLLSPVLSNSEILPSMYLLWLDAPGIASSARPGQFAMIRCDDGAKRLLRRPMTVHTVEGSRIAFFYRAVGEGTRWLSRRRQGDTLGVLGPLGNGFNIGQKSRHLLLVAGGMGLAPLRFLAETAIEEGRCVTLLAGAKTASALYPADLLPDKASYVPATEDGSLGETGLVTDLVPRHAAGVGQAFACGPEAMYRTLARERASRPPGLKVQLSLEVRMGCGVGACLSCTIETRSGPRHVCTDGPVFDLDEVKWGSAPVCAL
ncbi:MAG: dihydroorotate dehydrogenase electron transfer subunit [Chloroflexi bacterium]|nr:dihydroorotate dehydrogenase electron transfer subunit [Chloroflexota bacterium]